MIPLCFVSLTQKSRILSNIDAVSCSNDTRLLSSSKRSFDKSQAFLNALKSVPKCSPPSKKNICDHISYGLLATGVPVIIKRILNNGDNSKKSFVSLESGFFIFADSSIITATERVFKNSFNLAFSFDIVSKFVTMILEGLLNTKKFAPLLVPITWVCKLVCSLNSSHQLFTNIFFVTTTTLSIA